jgi:hypothetical protein
MIIKVILFASTNILYTIHQVGVCIFGRVNSVIQQIMYAEVYESVVCHYITDSLYERLPTGSND